MKTLVFLNKNSLAPIGGPLGYVYTLYKEDENREQKLNFIEDPVNQVKTKGSVSRIQKFHLSIREKLYFIKILLWGKRNPVIELNKYDIIHFHSTLELYKHRRSLKRFKGIVVLTSHSPIILSQEFYQSAMRWEQIIFKPLYLALKAMDIGAFELSDYVVFPCEEAEEPYKHSWRGFKTFKKRNMQKFKYLLTGTYERYPKKSSASIRTQLNIPPNAFVVCYVGRHNEIKGFDSLKELGKTILDKNDNVYFVIAGKEEPLKGIEHERWIEVGWTTDPHSFINAADVFILPNKETYFDLILLEVLSLGQIVLASRTGGNKFFDNEDYPGILEYSTVEEAEIRINELINMADEIRKTLRISNKEVFLQYFNSDVFYENYLELLNEISKGK